MNSTFRFLPAVFLLLNTCLTAVPVILQSAEESYSLNQAIEYRIDQTGTLSPETVADEKTRLRPFPRESVQIPRQGVLWLLIQLHNAGTHTRWILENTMNVEKMELFRTDGKTWKVVQSSGNAVPFSQRELQTRNPAFEIELPGQSSTELLLRVSDYQSSSVRLSLQEETSFRNSYLNRTLLLGLVFGFFGALILYNLIVFIISRDISFLIYSLYMIAFFLNQAAQERLFSQYIEPHRPYGFFWFIVFGSATAGLGLEFFRRFIETPASMPRIDRIMRGLRSAALLLCISAFFYSGPSSADILNLLSLGAMAMILTVLVIRISQRDQLALICFLGSLLYLAGTAAEIVTTLVPIQVNGFILNAQLYGALLQVLFLGFALGSKTSRVRRRYLRMQEQFRERLESEVETRTLELEQANRRLRESAVTDPLTGLYNRMALQHRIAELDTYFQRQQDETGQKHPPISVAYLDLDNFKYYNDTFGHQIGDEVLKATAEILRENLRGYDLLYRIGGDEFLVIMPETEIREAERAARRVIAAFERSDGALRHLTGFSGGGTQPPPEKKLSISIGIASSGHSGTQGLEALINTADCALLQSKDQGKNRFTLA